MELLPEQPAADRRASAPDLELARLALAGNASARAQVLARLECVPRVLSSINQRFGAPLTSHDLADLAQQVFLLSWSHLDRFDGRVPLEAWAYGIARIEFLSALRRGRRTPTLVDADRLANHAEPHVESEIDDERVRAMLARLDPTDASLLHMRHFDGLDFEASARTLGLTLVSARSRYYRALERLRSLYGASSEDAQR